MPTATASASAPTPTADPTPGPGAGIYPLEGPVSCTATGYFHMEVVGDRWWFCAPDGRVDFTRAVALATDSSSGASGHGFRHYDKVCLVPKGSSVCQDVTNAAWDSNGGIGDVIMSGSNPAYSLQNSGDAIIIGSSTFAPEFMQFQNATMGKGGTITWYFYSSAASDCGGAAPCWALLNGAGKPAAVDTPNSAGSYYFDVSGSVGTIDRPVLNTGFIGNASASSGVNRMELWTPNQPCPATGTSCIWPAGFTPQVLAGVSSIGDTNTRYWIKGVVATAFSTPPLIAQVYESRDTDDMLNAKYGGQYYTPYIKWFNNDIPKITSYGINATGQASNRYWQMLMGGATGDGGLALAPNATVPAELSWNTSDLVMRSTNAFTPPLVNDGPVKNMMSNVGSTFCGGYEGRTPDAYDPQYPTALTNSVKFFTGQGSWSGNGNSLPDASKTYALLTEEADDLFLVGAKYHEHLGALVLMSNPYMSSDPGSGVNYSDPVFYSKTLGLRDFLANEYGCSGSADPAEPNYCGATAAANALAALNRAWATSYTTWNTSSGSISNGSNAYKTGSGLLDEDGSNVITSCGAVDYNHANWTRTPAVRTDLDSFVAAWSKVYGEAMQTALSTVLTTAAVKPPIFTPLYTGPDQAYQAISLYTDGFWTNPGESTDGTTYSFNATQANADVTRIAADTTKPIIVNDYATASGSVQGAIYCPISGLAYNTATGNTTITASNCPYVSPVAVALTFPDAANSAACPSTSATPSSVTWQQSAGTGFVVTGNYASCLAVGNHLQSMCGAYLGACPDDFSTWTAATNAEIARFNAMLNVVNSGNLKPVVGIEWWDLFPEDLISSGEAGGYGFLTYNDNLFDGTTDIGATGTDANRYPTGGEEPNTPSGNRLSGSSGLGTYLNSLYSNLD